MKPALTSLFNFTCVALLCSAIGLQHLKAQSPANKISGELQILNSTRNVQGYLYNIGNGVVQFKENFFSANWDSIGNKPLTFPPSVHTHTIPQVIGLPDSLAALRNAINTTPRTLNQVLLAGNTSNLSASIDTMFGNHLFSRYGTVTFRNNSTGFRSVVSQNNPAANINLLLPQKAGQLALLSDLHDSLMAASTIDWTKGYPTYDSRYLQTANFQDNRLISGGQITKLSDYVYNVAAATYTINGTFFSSPSTNVTLSAPAPLLDRIDLFVLTTGSSAVAIGGTPASNPVPPNHGITTQLPINFAYVKSAVNVTAGSAVWGAITGNISDQHDLDSALNTRMPKFNSDSGYYVGGDNALHVLPPSGGGGSTFFGIEDSILNEDRVVKTNNHIITFDGDGDLSYYNIVEIGSDYFDSYFYNSSTGAGGGVGSSAGSAYLNGSDGTYSANFAASGSGAQITSDNLVHIASNAASFDLDSTKFNLSVDLRDSSGVASGDHMLMQNLDTTFRVAVYDNFSHGLDFRISKDEIAVKSIYLINNYTTITPTQVATEKLMLYNLPIADSEAIATSGGIPSHTVYQTSTGELRIKL